MNIQKENNLTEEQRNHLINSLGKKFVIRTIKGFGFLQGKNNFFDDLIQEGLIGLWIASKKYNPSIASFPTYARYWIKAYVFSRFKKEINLYSPLIFIKNKDLNNKIRTRIFSFNKPLSFSDGDNDLVIEDIIYDYNAKERQILEEENQIKTMIMNEIKDYFKYLCSTKNERTSTIYNEIFYNRLLSEDPMALHEIGQKYNVSKQRIDQLERQIIFHLFNKFSNNKKDEKLNKHDLLKQKKKFKRHILRKNRNTYHINNGILN